MSDPPAWKTALSQFVDEVKNLYGARLRHVVLYGSRARGDADQDADLDVLVVLDRTDDFWSEFSRLAPVAARIALEHDVVLSAIPADAAEFAQPATPLLLNARREGVFVA